MRENLELDFKRIFTGFFIFFIIITFYIISIDFILLLLICSLSLLDLFKSKIINYKFFLFVTALLIFSFLITSIFQFQDLFLLISFWFLILFSIFLRKGKNIFFCASLIIFLYFFIKTGFLNRDIFYFIIFISFLNDTSAYIFGKLLKGPLILPLLSPKKTWSGTFFSTLISSMLIYYFGYNLIFAFIISASFFFGDIFFSFIKRINKIKDFSNLLPGHGGILDRIDSMFFPTIFFFVYNIFLL